MYPHIHYGDDKIAVGANTLADALATKSIQVIEGYPTNDPEARKAIAQEVAHRLADHFEKVEG
jgi:hypothetical protein